MTRHVWEQTFFSVDPLLNEKINRFFERVSSTGQVTVLAKQIDEIVHAWISNGRIAQL